MIAGTLAQLVEPVDEPLETWFRQGGLPGLQVKRTQTSFDDRPVQSGTAATRTESTTQRVNVGVNSDGESVAVDVRREETMEDIVTDWVADVTGSGLLAAESVTGDGEFAFPFDLFTSLTDRRVSRLQVNVHDLHEAWSDAGTLGDVWMVGAEDGEATRIDYHDAADATTRPTIGLGFERPWNGTVERGVVYQSGYVAVYSSNTAASFIRFVEEELLPYTEAVDEDTEQQTLDDASTDDEASCRECGREVDGDAELCIVCLSGEERGTA